MRTRRSTKRRLPYRKHPVSASVIALALSSGFSCGVKNGATTDQKTLSTQDGTKSTTKPTIGSTLANLPMPTSLADLLNILKSSGLVKALKDAYAKGVCKPEITEVVSTGRSMVTSLIKGGFTSILSLGSKTQAAGVDLSVILPSLTSLGKCVAEAAPDIFKSIEASMLSNMGTSTTASKLVEPGGPTDAITDEDADNLDIQLWAESAEGAAAEPQQPDGPVGDPGVPADAPTAP